MHYQIITTKDNSHTIFLPHLNEHYHSIHGAIQESDHVFIKNGLEYYVNTFIKTNSKHPSPLVDPSRLQREGQGEVLKKLNISILEIGFGTGLNALLTLLKASEFSQVQINYSTIEAHPLPMEIIEQLNYTSILGLSSFNLLHLTEWNKPIEITNNFTIHKIHNTLQQINLTEKYHIIFFDAFAPEKQPEMWTKEIFEKLFLHLHPQSILVTYCAKGIIKRTLKEIGFSIEALQGPPGKREMIRAIKKS